MKILIKDNYFKDPDSIRKLALSLNKYANIFLCCWKVEFIFEMFDITWGSLEC